MIIAGHNPKLRTGTPKILLIGIRSNKLTAFVMKQIVRFPRKLFRKTQDFINRRSAWDISPISRTLPFIFAVSYFVESLRLRSRIFNDLPMYMDISINYI